VLLIAGTATAGFALLCFYSNLLLGTDIGVDVEQYKGIPATYGLQYEGNILAAYCGALAVMMMTMYVMKRKRGYLLGYGAFGLAGMFISLSRAAVGATAIGLLLVVIWGLWRKFLNGPMIYKTAAVTLAVLVVLMPIILPFYLDRFSTVDVADVSEDPNTALRLVQAASAVDNILAHPILGNGTASFQLNFGWEELGVKDWGDAWISNTEMRVLHDTGIIGFGIFVAFLIGLLRQAWKALKQKLNPELLALLFAAVVYSITFQITEGTLLAFSWVHLGLIACAVSYLNRQKSVAEK
jgi:O-antigen ligase